VNFRLGAVPQPDEHVGWLRLLACNPATWVKPWTGQYVMGPAIGQIYEFACNEGNYGLYNNLNAARVLEKQAAEKNAK